MCNVSWLFSCHLIGDMSRLTVAFERLCDGNRNVKSIIAQRQSGREDMPGQRHPQLEAEAEGFLHLNVESLSSFHRPARSFRTADCSAALAVISAVTVKVMAITVVAMSVLTRRHGPRKMMTLSCAFDFEPGDQVPQIFRLPVEFVG